MYTQHTIRDKIKQIKHIPKYLLLELSEEFPGDSKMSSNQPR